MAYRRIGRDDDHSPSKWPTNTDDEDESPETSSSVSKQLLQTPTTGFQPTAITPYLPTPTKDYPSKMSGQPDKPWPSDIPDLDERPSGSGPPPHWPPNDDSTTRGYPWSSSTLRTAYWDHLQSSTASTTPTLVRTDESSSSTPTDDDFLNLHDHGADNGPNRTPMYAAAGVTPVVVIVIGFLVFFCLRKRRRQREAAAVHGHIEEMKMQPKPVVLPYIAPITPPSPPPAVLPQYSPSTPSSSHPPTASSSQPVILGPIASGNNSAYLTGMDTSDLVSMTSAGNISRSGTVVDRDPFADGRSLEEAPPPYRPSSLPPASLASTSRHSSVRMAAPPQMTSRTHLIERSPFDDPDDDDVSEVSGPAMGRSTGAMSDVSDLSYQVDPVIGRSPF